MSTEKAIWISYDFGLKGDYNGLYTWLDQQNAVECGNGLAFVKFAGTDYPTSLNSKAGIIKAIENQLNEAVKLTKSDRIYIVFKDPSTGRVKGHFISGGRKQPPWAGYAGISQNESDDAD